MERDTLLRLFRALADEGVEYALVGGLAVNLHGVIRAREVALLERMRRRGAAPGTGERVDGARSDGVGDRP